MTYKKPPIRYTLHNDKETLRMLDELNKMTAEELAQFDSMTEVREECLRRAKLTQTHKPQ